MNAYLGGAQYVKALDISEKALEDAQNNFKLNAMDIDTECGDIFEILKKLSEEKTKSYDFIILDPPAFTKSRKTINSALKGYEEINYLAMKSLPRGGFLATASCSHFATYDLFKKALVDASIKAGVTLKLVSFSSAAPDHPIIMTIPETEYLKFFIFQII
jgi:23S rRNA (cytosine1962-C5)-methyltransferase